MALEPGLTELITTTLRNRRKSLTNSIENNNPVSRSMKENGTFEMESGGRTLVDEAFFDDNDTFMRYTAGQVLNTSFNNTMTAFEVDWKQFAVSVTAHGREIRQNSGPEGVLKLLKNRITAAEYTLENNFNADLISNGTADGSLQIQGLKYWISRTPTTGVIGGIDRALATGAFAQNVKYATASDTFAGSTGLTTLSNVKNRLNYLINATTRGSDKVKIILAGQGMFESLQNANDNITRIVDESKTAKTGYTSLTHMGVPVYMCGGVNFGGQTQVATDEMFGVNTKFTKIRIHKDAYFEPLKELQSIHQDAIAQLIVFMGNMTCSAPKLNFVMYDS